MKYVEKFPDPGPMLPVPGEQPSMSDNEKWNEWSKQARAYNDHLKKLRQHRIAASVDVLAERSKGRDWHLDPTDHIALTMGVMFLDGTIQERDPLDFYGNLFRGIF